MYHPSNRHATENQYSNDFQNSPTNGFPNTHASAFEDNPEYAIENTIEKLSNNFLKFKESYETRLKSLERPPLPQIKPLEQKSLTSENQGEFLVREEVRYRVLEQLQNLSLVRKHARVDTISTDKLEVIKDKGQTDCGWVYELDERSDTDTPEFVKQIIDVHELYAKPKISQKLIDDSAIDIEKWLSEHIAYKMSLLENQAFLQGDGMGKPKGILQNKDISVIEGGIDDTLLHIQAALPSHYHANAIWFMSPSALSYIKLLKSRQTGQYMWQPQLHEKAYQTLLGHRIEVCEQMENLEEGKIAVIFGSFYQGYQIVDRNVLSVMRDPYSAKPFVEFYARRRVGGDVINPEAFVFWRFKKEG